jgi:hypothetical protein
MSDSLAPSTIVAKLIGAFSIAVGKRKTPIRCSLIAAVIPALFVGNVTMAQVTGMASPTPTIDATSPLGMGTDSAVSPTGIPLGSTEIASPGISPAPVDVTGTISIPSNGTTCSTIGIAPSGMFGSAAAFDGGGMGTATPATAANSGTMASGMSTSSGISTTSGILDTSGLSGMCGSGSSSMAASSAPTSTMPITPGGAARTGIPLGSTEIGNLGISSAAAVPMVSVSPTVATMEPVPTIPTITSPPTVSSAATNPFPCQTAGTSRTTVGC